MCKAWAPGHATLFFAVPKRYKRAQEMGSVGGGFNFEEGVVTHAQHSDENKVYWNNNEITGKVTLTCIELFNKKFNSSDKFIIKHSSKIPIGYGLSTSGAGSISTLLALKSLNNAIIGETELYKIAHEAEIIHHTGLGSVVGQIASGVELRITQGGPDICEMISFYEEIEVILLFFGPLDTSKIITSDKKMIDVTTRLIPE